MRSLRPVLGAGLGCVVALALLGSPSTAKADPPSSVGAPPANSVVGVGSDTTEYVLDQLAQAYDALSPTPPNPLYSWDATGTSPIKTKSSAPAPIARPDGGNAGIAALLAYTSATVDFARSDSYSSTNNPTKIKFIPFAHDATTVAVQTTTHAPANLTTAQLKSIYTCATTNWVNFGGTPGTIAPFLPQSGSDMRTFFETAIGITDAQVGACVNGSVQDNQGTDARLNSPDAIVPYSVAKYIAQLFRSGPGQNSFGTDQHGSLKLDSINGTAPTTGSGTSTTITPSFSAAFAHNVYNVVRKDTTTGNQVPAYEQKIFDSAGATIPGFICANITATAIIKNYGFLPLTSSQCGA